MRYRKDLILIFVCFLVIWQSEAVNGSTRQNSSAKQKQPSRFRLHLSLFSRYNDNFFQADSDEPKDEVFLNTLSGKSSLDLVRGKTSTLTAELTGSRTFVTNVKDADWYRFDATLDYKFGRNDIRLTYFHNPDGLALRPMLEGDLSNGENGIDLRFSSRLTRRTRISLGYTYASGDLFESIQERIDSGEFKDDFTDRFQDLLDLIETSSANHEIEGDVSYRIHDLFIPGIGLNLARRSDKSIGSSYDQATLVLQIESHIKNATTLNLRYRYRLRDYTTDDPTFSNFDRKDNRHSGELYVLFKPTYHWWPFLYGSYKTNDSTRANRSYTVIEVGIGMLFRFQ